MILFRLSSIGGKHCAIEGGPKLKKIYKYADSDAGWFVVDSVDFGFVTQNESKLGKKTSNNGAQQTGSSNRGSSQGSTNSQEEKEDFDGMNVTKTVDGVTTLLMGLAMQDRGINRNKKAKKGKSTGIHKADIHFLHSVKRQDEDQFIFPYMLITLDRVLIKGWKINATGDDRPTETLELGFEKAAMKYFLTKDGKNWITVDPKGWDQTKNEEWKPWDSPGEAPYFVDPPHS